MSSNGKPAFYLIVAGGRDYTDTDRIVQEVFKLMVGPLASYQVEIIHGGARGADLNAGIAAARLNLPVHVCQANWDRDGKQAGILRNLKMAEKANGLLAFWDGSSTGTKHMIETMRNQGKSVRVISY